MKADKIIADNKQTIFICFFVKLFPHSAITVLEREIFKITYKKLKIPPFRKFFRQKSGIIDKKFNDDNLNIKKIRIIPSKIGTK